MANARKKRSLAARYPRAFRYVYLKMIRKNDAPERLGRGAGVGIFIGIFPTLWFGPALAIALAGLMQANRAAALLGSFASGPLTPITWTLAAIIGNQLVHPDYRIAAHLLSWENRGLIAERFFVTFLLGNVIVCIVFSLATYALVWWVATRRQRGRAASTVIADL